MTERALLGAVLRPRRGDVALGSVLVVLHQCCEALVAIVIGIVVDEAIGPRDAGRLVAWVGVLAAVFAVLATSALVGYYRLDRVAETIAHDVRERMATAEAGSAGARELERSADAATRGRTVLVVAHRLTQAAAADRVAVVADGRIVEDGPHARLAAGTGAYAALWTAWSAGRPGRSYASKIRSR